jgi:hypothetical protein
MDNDTTPVEIEEEATVPVPTLTNAELMLGKERGAYALYVRDVRREGGEPSNFSQWRYDYGWDIDDVEPEPAASPSHLFEDHEIPCATFGIGGAR